MSSAPLQQPTPADENEQLVNIVASAVGLAAPVSGRGGAVNGRNYRQGQAEVHNGGVSSS